MRFAPWIMLAAVLTAGPAQAEFPAAFGAHAGVGAGSGALDGRRDEDLGGLVSIDASWRFRPGRALVVSYELAGMGPIGTSHIPEASYFSGAGHRAITLGSEWSTTRQPFVADFFRVAAGVGSVHASWHSSFFDPPALQARSETGLAISGELGLRALPAPGPLGLRIGVHTTHVVAAHVSCHVYAVFVGFAVHPIRR